VKVASYTPGLDEQADGELDPDDKPGDRPRLGSPKDEDELREPLVFIDGDLADRIEPPGCKPQDGARQPRISSLTSSPKIVVTVPPRRTRPATRYSVIRCIRRA
jgi:hypothetical protein